MDILNPKNENKVYVYNDSMKVSIITSDFKEEKWTASFKGLSVSMKNRDTEQSTNIEQVSSHLLNGLI